MPQKLIKSKTEHDTVLICRTLHIKDVQKEDKGFYMCQVNTDPMVSTVGFLDVVGMEKDSLLSLKTSLLLLDAKLNLLNVSILSRRKLMGQKTRRDDVP